MSGLACTLSKVSVRSLFSLSLPSPASIPISSKLMALNATGSERRTVVAENTDLVSRELSMIHESSYDDVGIQQKLGMQRPDPIRHVPRPKGRDRRSRYLE